MPKKKRVGVFVDLPESIVKTLSDTESLAGLPINEHLRTAIMGVVSTIAKADRRLGRPPTVIPKLPADIERGDIASGFVGVYSSGKKWKAFWDKGEGPLGIFELAEEAALARYWYNKGIVSRMAILQRETGSSEETISEMARTMGALQPQKPFHVGDLVDYDPVIGQGPMRRKVRIIAGPVVLSEGAIEWRLEGFTTPARQEDLDHALED